jgi:hypothetical protein
LTITYAVGTANPDDYRLAASASFLDALSYGIPGLYLRNRYIEHYFDRMGDIGYLCSTAAEIEETALSLAADFPVSRYVQQRQNILLGRQVFDPKTIATQLRAIVDADRVIP